MRVIGKLGGSMNRDLYRLIVVTPHAVGMPLPINADGVCVNLKQRILVDEERA